VAPSENTETEMFLDSVPLHARLISKHENTSYSSGVSNWLLHLKARLCGLSCVKYAMFSINTVNTKAIIIE
jgi:hypothetical protein